MNALKLCVTAEELSKFINDRLPAHEVAGFSDCTWIPARVFVTENLGIEVIVVPAK